MYYFYLQTLPNCSLEKMLALMKLILLLICDLWLIDFLISDLTKYNT